MGGVCVYCGSPHVEISRVLEIPDLWPLRGLRPDMRSADGSFGGGCGGAMGKKVFFGRERESKGSS